jgi:hypothetical protein
MLRVSPSVNLTTQGWGQDGMLRAAFDGVPQESHLPMLVQTVAVDGRTKSAQHVESDLSGCALLQSPSPSYDVTVVCREASAPLTVEAMSNQSAASPVQVAAFQGGSHDGLAPAELYASAQVPTSTSTYTSAYGVPPLLFPGGIATNPSVMGI